MSTQIKPYLIQRATKQNNSDKKGLDSILSFDYMGSAEFEFGALPASLKRIRENKNKYSLHNTYISYKNKKVFIQIYTKETIEDIIPIIEKLSTDSIRLKEHSRFKEYLNKTQSIYTKTNFWWDIENDFMFWPTEDGSFKNKFLQVI